MLGLIGTGTTAYATDLKDTAATATSIMTCMKTKSFCDGGILSTADRDAFNEFMSSSGADGRMKILVMETTKNRDEMTKIVNNYFKDTSTLDSKSYGIMAILAYDKSADTVFTVSNGMNDAANDFNVSTKKIKSSTVKKQLESMKPSITKAAETMKTSENRSNIWDRLWQWLGYVFLGVIAILTIMFMFFVGRRHKGDARTDDGAVV
jgi:Fe2+ transport system protein B